MRPTRCLLLTLAFSFSIPAVRAADGGATTAAKSLVKATDVLKLAQVGSPVLSPDGRSVAYAVKTMVEKPDKPDEYVYQTRIWLASTDGITSPREITRGVESATSPAWSPDGRFLAFVRKEKDKPQLWILPLADGGESYPVTTLDSGATDPQWSPDGKWIAFLSSLSATEVRQELAATHNPLVHPAWNERPGRSRGDVADWFEKDKDAKRPIADADGSRQEVREWLARDEADGNPREIDRLGFIGEADLEPQRKHALLYIVPPRPDAKAKILTVGYRAVQAPAWSPDSQRLVYAIDADSGHDPDRDLNSELETVRIADGVRTTILNDNSLSVDQPEFSPDGSMIAFLCVDVVRHPNYAQTHLAFLPAEGAAAPRIVDSFDRSVTRAHWAPDSKSVLCTAASNGGFPLYRVSTNPNAKVEPLTSTETGVGDFNVRADKVAYVFTQYSNPSELSVADLSAEHPRVLTTHNEAWMKDRKLSRPEHRSITRGDGVAMDVWIMKPTDFVEGKKYPLLLEIHGGPSAMWGPGEASMWHEFQYFAARGYGVVYSNPRGSGGYGFAFQHANYQDWGPTPGSDVLAAADLAAQEPWVDRDRQVVTGGSYGGYMTAWIVGHDQRFKAAVAVRGVYDLSTFFGEGNAWELVPFEFGGYPWEKNVRAILDANSPITFVEQIHTPLLIKHGDADLRTGFVQSEMLYKSLKVLGRPVEYVRYPRATHELSRSGEPRQRLDRIVRFDEFFQRYIGDGAAKADVNTFTGK